MARREGGRHELPWVPEFNGPQPQRMCLAECGRPRPQRRRNAPAGRIVRTPLSILLGHLFVAVLRVGYQFLAFRVDNEVEIFQRYLAQKIGNVVINLNDLEGSMPAHEIEAGSLVNRPSACAVGRLGNNLALFPQTQGFDHTPLEVEPGGSCVHEDIGLDDPRFFSPELKTLEFQVEVVGQFDLRDDFSHAGRV
jgi:hypothetical protein